MLKLLRYGKPYALMLLAAIVLLFGQASCDLALPDYMGNMVNQGITEGDSAYILRTGVKMLVISLIGGILSVTVGFISARIAAGFSRDLRRDVFTHVESFSNIEFDRFSTSSLITRTTNDIMQIQMLIVMLIRMVFYAPILGVGGFLRAWSTDRSMSWIILLAVGLLMGLVLGLMHFAMPKFKIVQSLIDRLNQVVRENLSGMPVIRAFNTQKFEEKRFDEVNAELTDVNLFINRLMSAMMPVMMLIMNLITVLIIWVGAGQVADLNMQVGGMMAYMQYVMQIMMAFLMMSMMFIMVPRASVSAGRIAEVLATESTIKDPKEAQEASDSRRETNKSSDSRREANQPSAGKKEINQSSAGQQISKEDRTVRFEKVRFAYPQAEEDVLHDIDFAALPGETTVVIGSTGSGKSTLVNLIPRFYDVTGGRITIGGTDIRQMTLRDLRGLIGYVPQKSALFSGTIRSNLSYADENASMEQISHAAGIAQALEFINEKSDGFDAEVSQGGSNLSGGQKQRLSIGRALLNRPAIYIFDDSFSALDYKTDARLRGALKTETRGSIVLLVTQRVSTAMTADRIIVLDKGRVAGKGTHQELMDSCAVYREIALSQLEQEELS